MDNLTAKLYQTAKTVFNIRDLGILWQEIDSSRLKAKAAYYVKQGAIIRLTRGIFAKNKNYNPLELANSISSPSYISFETALRAAGLVFQHYDTIFVAGKWSKTFQIGQTKLVFRKIKDSVLYNPRGIESAGNYSIAGRERAFLDMIYLFPEYYFDNLSSLDWDKCFEIAEIYNNKQLTKRASFYKKKYVE